MRFRHIRACIFAIVAGGLLAAVARAQETSSGPELLTADQAVKIAVANNRYLKIVTLDLDISKDKVAVAKTHRYPAMSVYTFA